jgi:hypothetical protein
MHPHVRRDLARLGQLDRIKINFNGVGGSRTYIRFTERIGQDDRGRSTGDVDASERGVALTNLKSVKMIEAVAAILGLFSAGIFVAHAVDAYRAP